MAMMKRSTLRYLGGAGLLATAYFGAAQFGLQFSTLSPNVISVWPPTGLALAALLLFGNRLWPGVALGAVLATVSTGAPLEIVVGVAVGNTLEALVGAHLLRRVGFHHTLDRIRDVLCLLLFSAGLSTTLSATIGAASWCLAGRIAWSEYGSIWPVWWLGNATGALVVAPMLLTWGSSPRPRWPLGKLIEVGALVASALILSQTAFGQSFLSRSVLNLAAYFIFALLIWVALRFGPRGTATLSFIASSLAVVGTARGVGAFGQQTIDNSLLFLWAYVIGVSVVSMLLAAAARERMHAVAAQAQLLERLKSLEPISSPLPSGDAEPDQAVSAFRLGAPLLTVAMVAIIIMLVFEVAKEVLDVGLAEWQSHAVTIAFVGLVAPLGAYLALRRQKMLYQQIIDEVSERRRVEEIQKRLTERTHQLEQTTQTLQALVTERQRAEEALQQERDFALTVMNALGQGVTVTGPGGLYEYVNPVYARMLGYTPENMIGMTPQDITVPEDFHILQQAHARRKMGETTSYETRLLRVDGSLIHALTTGVPRWHNDQVLGTIAVVTDLTERKQTEDVLRESEEQLRQFFELAPTGKAVTTLDGRYIHANRAYCELVGYTLEELQTRTFTEITHPDDVDDDLSLFQRPAQDKLPQYYLEKRYIRKGGDIVHVLIQTTLLHDADGQPKYIIGQAVDITDRKNAEEKIRKLNEELELRVTERTMQLAAANRDLEREIAERQRMHEQLLHTTSELQAVFQASPDLYFRLDPEGTYLDYLAGPTSELYASPQTFMGKKIRDVMPPEIAGQLHAAVRKAYQTRTMTAVEYTLPTSDGANYFEARLFPFLETQVIAIVRDITRRKQAEERIRKLNVDLERRAQELEAANKELEAFSYSVSHDLRAPLRAIDGFSRILLKDFAPQVSPDAQRYIRLVTDNANRMGQLIDDLLAFSRLSRQPVKKQPIALSELVQQTADDLRLDYQGRQVKFVIGDLPACQGDPPLLKQVITNLLSNAIKFTRQREAARIEIGSFSNDGEVVYFVKDNGVGFDMRYAHKLFGVFQRLHRSEDYEGTGVGLAIVQRIIHRHGGRVWAEAGPDEGSTFYFTI